MSGLHYAFFHRNYRKMATSSSPCKQPTIKITEEDINVETCPTNDRRKSTTTTSTTSPTRSRSKSNERISVGTRRTSTSHG